MRNVIHYYYNSINRLVILVLKHVFTQNINHKVSLQPEEKTSKTFITKRCIFVLSVSCISWS